MTTLIMHKGSHYENSLSGRQSFIALINPTLSLLFSQFYLVRYGKKNNTLTAINFFSLEMFFANIATLSSPLSI